MDTDRTSTTTAASTTTAPPPPSPPPPRPRWRRLAVIGDSIAAGLGDPVPGVPDVPWSLQLAQLLGLDPADVHVGGVPGATLGQIARRVDGALASGADLIVVTGGGNDLLAGDLDPEDTRRRLRRILEPLTAHQRTVVTFGLFDVSAFGLVPAHRRGQFRAALQMLNGATRSVTEEVGGVFVDFFDHPEQSPRIFSRDRLHPNRLGHRIIAHTVATQLLAVAAPGPARH